MNKNVMIKLPLAVSAALAAGSCSKVLAAGKNQPTVQSRPHIIIIYSDDFGYSDINLYGGNFCPTPNMDRIGKEGIQFNQYYSACPISSPSRVGMTTGMYPTQWGITTFLNDRKANYNNKSNDYLLTDAPAVARSFQAAGYATGHFGKWHMGGGRDVKDMPQITEYGFDEYVSTWESPDPDPRITASNWIWCDDDEIKRWDRTAYFVDKTLAFLEKNKNGKPCYIHLWPDDMHTPYVPNQKAYDEGHDKKGAFDAKQNFIPVLAEYDRQIGRLLDGLEKLGIAENTIVIFTSDNGPNPSYKNARTDGLRGQKGTLYEGGIRLPFLIRWPAKIKPGQVNDETVLCSIDIFPTVCALAGITPVTNGYTLDGLDMSKHLLGSQNRKRGRAMFWEFGQHFVGQPYPNNPYHTRSPNIAMRDGDWKCIVNYDGSHLELYNIKTDKFETTNVAETYPKVAEKMSKQCIEWFNLNFRRYAGELRNPAK